MTKANSHDGSTGTDSTSYQLGAYSVDDSGVDLGGGEFVEFEMEMQAVFKRLADDIYESDEAGIREPLTNAVTAVLRAQTEYNIGDEGVIEIELHENEEDGSLTLTLRDNGIGITREELQEVVAVIGRSTTRDSGSLAGQFGMGFLAVFKLVGTDGGFVMHTHSRKDDAEPFSGVWKSGGFSFDDDNELDGGLDEDEYGTKFEFILKDDIDADDVRKWVRKHSEWARVPVIYREFNGNGRELRNDDFGCKPLTSEYDEDEPYVEYENEYFYATSSPEADKRSILLDVPIRRNHFSVRSAPWGVDIRLKNENSIVVDGPHEGLMPVEDAEYEAMPPARRDPYIAEGDLIAEDIVMPGPIGTRDSLAAKNSFWSWVGDRLYECYEVWGESVCRNLTSKADVLGLSPDEFSLVMEVVQDCTDEGENPTRADVEAAIADTFSVDLPEEVSGFLAALATEVTVIEEDEDITDDLREERTVPAWKVGSDGPAPTGETAGEVFMGCNLNQLKADVVWEDSSANRVVKVDSSSVYDLFEEYLGWRKLREVTRGRIDEFDISEETERQFRDEMGKSENTVEDLRNETLTLRFGPDITGAKEQVKDVREKFENQALGGYTPRIGGGRPRKLVLFPDGGEANVSDYFGRGSKRVAIARCSDAAAEHLTDVRNIVTFEEYREQALDSKFITNNGWWTFTPDDYREVALHIAPEETVNLLQEPDVLNSAPRFLDQYSTENSVHWDDHLSITEDSVLYVPLTEEELYDIQLFIDDQHLVTGDVTLQTHHETNSVPSGTALYAYASLAEGGDITGQPPEVRFLLNATQGLMEGGRELVDELASCRGL